MKKQYSISVFSENKIGLLNRVSSIFTRRHVNIESLNVSESEVKGIHRFTIVVTVTEVLVNKIIKQLEKQVEVVKSFYHDLDEIVHQEIALYKVPTTSLASGGAVEKIVRSHQARILTIESEFTIIEKTGHKEETQALFDELRPFGLLEFARSGRVVITKPMKEFKEYMAEVEAASKN